MRAEKKKSLLGDAGKGSFEQSQNRSSGDPDAVLGEGAVTGAEAESADGPRAGRPES